MIRHLHPWVTEYRPSALDRQVFPADDARPLPEPTPCPDTALVAFAQLCALRLRARRCFVSLISSNVEYVLAEATRTMSLQYDTVEDAKDRAWLGTCSFMRDDGMSTEHMDAWRRARQIREALEDNDHFYTDGTSAHWHIISDVRNNDVYSRRNFVLRSPALRFYAAIPLRGAHGSVLGSLTVVDDIPRYGISATELSFMEDVADTITQHLDATVVRSQRQRSERMVQGLGLFNNGKSSLRHWWLKQEDVRNANIGRHGNGIQPADERSAAADREFGLNAGSSSDKETSSSHEDVVPDGAHSRDSEQPRTITASATTMNNSQASISRTSEHVSSQDFGGNRLTRQPFQISSIPEEDSVDSASASPRPMVKRAVTRNRTAVNEDFDLATASQHTYARASNLMREALSAAGVVFVNPGTSASDGRNSTSELSSASDALAQPLTSEGETSDAVTSGSRIAPIHAFSTMNESTARGSKGLKNRFDMSTTFLNSLIRRYPNGHIFNFTEDGAAYSSSNEGTASSESATNSDRSRSRRRRLPRDGKRLGEIMVGAKTIAFYPVWDETHDRYSSVVFVWSGSPLRYFDPVEDITYLASWGHSVLAELRRLETIATDRAKGTFISSVSHELRSPLHGVLAGVEFLDDTELTSFQQEMTHTISMAGRALLDTVDHILDHAKMSTFTRAQRRHPADSNAVRHMADNTNRKGQAAENEFGDKVNLAHLTEDIVETVVSAYRFQNQHQLNATKLSVITNIPWRENWNVELSAGGWTRIVQNLVGNALKYTSKGVVTIRLDVGKPTPQSSEESGSAHQLWPVRFSVRDTGIGIGTHFLANGLYTPFKQENSHSSGTGLGLSIVRQICRDMGAKLGITSEVGKGTSATVDFKTSFLSDEKALQKKKIGSTQMFEDPGRKLNVEHFHWIVPDFGSSSEGGDDEPADCALLDIRVGGSALETAKEWLDCAVSQGSDLTVQATTAPWIYAITENHLSQWVQKSADNLQEEFATGAKISTHVLVLASSLDTISSKASLGELPFTPVFIHQPIGPQKLLRAIISDQSSTLMGESKNTDGASDRGGGSRMESAAESCRGTTSALQSAFASQVGENDSHFRAARDHSKHDRTSNAGASVQTRLSSIADNALSTDSYGGRRSGTPISTPSLPSGSTRDSTFPWSSDDEDDSILQQVGPQERDKILLVEDNDINMKVFAPLSTIFALCLALPSPPPLLTHFSGRW
nr:hybrid signal transduction histidine kinase b [Quercus suber]